MIQICAGVKSFPNHLGTFKLPKDQDINLMLDCQLNYICAEYKNHTHYLSRMILNFFLLPSTDFKKIIRNLLIPY